MRAIKLNKPNIELCGTRSKYEIIQYTHLIKVFNENMYGEKSIQFPGLI
jgi:hypothetical protein